MDLHQLRVFQAVVKKGGFTRAGEELRLSQSRVSQHIKLIEEELGGSLIMRVGKRVLVTEAGSVLLQYTELNGSFVTSKTPRWQSGKSTRYGVARYG